MFAYENGADTLLQAPNHPGFYRTNSSIDLRYFGPKEKGDAPSSSQVCIIVTGGSGDLAIDFYMLQRSRDENEPAVVMEANATFAVQD
ncbi:MAG: hypothetical protein H6817_03715 [Phycisphaerales bacterium]|nr:hypothetical protein [Phycisphaerales bacterium]